MVEVFNNVSNNGDTYHQDIFCYTHDCDELPSKMSLSQSQGSDYPGLPGAGCAFDMNKWSTACGHKRLMWLSVFLSKDEGDKVHRCLFLAMAVSSRIGRTERFLADDVTFVLEMSNEESEGMSFSNSANGLMKLEKCYMSSPKGFKEREGDVVSFLPLTIGAHQVEGLNGAAGRCLESCSCIWWVSLLRRCSNVSVSFSRDCSSDLCENAYSR